MEHSSLPDRYQEAEFSTFVLAFIIPVTKLSLLKASPVNKAFA
jgi:hypothetical protein